MAASPLESVRNYVEEIGRGLGEYLPQLLAATLLLAAGWAIAHALRGVVHRLVPRMFRLVPSDAFQRAVKTSGMEAGIADAIGGIVYWLLLLLFMAAATDVLGVPVVATLAAGMAQYLPNTLAAVLIVLAGLVLANIARTTVSAMVTSAGLPYGDLPGRLAQTAILLVAGVVAIGQVGIDSTFIIIVISIFLATTLGGLALSFGLGARATVSNILASHYQLHNYKVGQRIRIGAFEGRIVEVNNVAVLLDTPEGRVLVPASEFNERPSVLLREG